MPREGHAGFAGVAGCFLPVRPSQSLACDADQRGRAAEASLAMPREGHAGFAGVAGCFLPVRPSQSLACDADHRGRAGFAGMAV
jgi:hypothetical protein